MIEGLKPHSEYRLSGQDWLGKVPSHWRVCRIKTLMRETDVRSQDGKGVLLSLTRSRGLIPRRDMTDKVHGARTLVGYKRYHPGEIVMNRMQAWSGMFGAGNTSGLISPDYAVFSVLGDDLVEVLLARLKAPDMVSQFALASRAIGSGFNRLYSDTLGAIPMSLPPVTEQPLIFRFLRHSNSRIECFIRGKRKLIELLTEQKQAIVHQVVTRGLNPHARVKPSGIEWLGEIPAHWGVVRNMALFAHRVEAGSDSLPVLQISIRSGVTAADLDQFGRPKRLIADVHRYKRVRRSDLAYNTMRMWQGAVGVAPFGGLVIPAYVVLEPRLGTCSAFYNLLFRTDVYKQQVNRFSTRYCVGSESAVLG